MDLQLQDPEFFSPNKRVLVISIRPEEGIFIASRISEDGALAYLTIDRVGVFGTKYKHATCACKYPPGSDLYETLCGIITKWENSKLKKCPQCIQIFGNGPCPLCPPNCKTC